MLVLWPRSYWQCDLLERWTVRDGALAGGWITSDIGSVLVGRMSVPNSRIRESGWRLVTSDPNPSGYHFSYVADVNAVTPAQIQAAARTTLATANTDIVIAGDANLFWDALHAARPTAERIPVGELNLDSAALH